MHHVSRSFACWTCFPLCGILFSFLSVSVSVARSLFRIRGRLRCQSHRNFCCIFQGAHVAQVITFYRLYKKFLLPLLLMQFGQKFAPCCVARWLPKIHIYTYIWYMYPTSVYIGRYHAKWNKLLAKIKVVQKVTGEQTVEEEDETGQNNFKRLLLVLVYKYYCPWI